MIKNIHNYSLILFIWCVFSYSFADSKIYHYAYDSNGNTIAINQINGKAHQPLYTYRYNNLNQMVGFEDIQNQRSYSYLYYPDGRRLSKQGYRESDQEAIVFYYGHQGQLMNESYSKNNETIKQSSYFAGLRFIDDLLHSNDSHLQYPIADQHNHPATINFTQDATKIESYQLTDYGQLAQSNTKREDKQVTEQGLFNFEINPKIYGSGYYDSESNLQYMGARYYSADTQRFMAQDSYNLLNRYNYANDNPVMNYDPDGHSAVGNFAKSLVPHGIGGGIGLGVSIAADIAITSIALGANPSLGTLMMVGAISGGISNGLGTAAAESIDSGRISASDVRAQVVLGATIGALSGSIFFASKRLYQYHSVKKIKSRKVKLPNKDIYFTTRVGLEEVQKLSEKVIITDSTVPGKEKYYEFTLIITKGEGMGQGTFIQGDIKYDGEEVVISHWINRGTGTKYSGSDLFAALMLRLNNERIMPTRFTEMFTDTNYQIYRNLLQNGLSKTEALAKTWTGQRLAEWGYIGIEYIGEADNHFVSAKFYKMIPEQGYIP